jgi:hypothetical protein
MKISTSRSTGIDADFPVSPEPAGIGIDEISDAALSDVKRVPPACREEKDRDGDGRSGAHLRLLRGARSAFYPLRTASRLLAFGPPQPRRPPLVGCFLNFSSA